MLLPFRTVLLKPKWLTFCLLYFVSACQTPMLYSMFYVLLKLFCSNITCCDILFEFFVWNTFKTNSPWILILGLIFLSPSSAPNIGLCIQWVMSFKIYSLLLVQILLWWWLEPSSTEFLLWGVHITEYKPYHLA